MTLDECIDELYVLKEDIENKSVDIEYAIDGLARILPLLDAAFQKTQWQPIEELKKDKPLDFICYFPHEKVKVQPGWTNGKGSTVMGNMFDYDMTSQPSHFMIVRTPTEG